MLVNIKLYDCIKINLKSIIVINIYLEGLILVRVFSIFLVEGLMNIFLF